VRSRGGENPAASVACRCMTSRRKLQTGGWLGGMVSFSVGDVPRTRFSTAFLCVRFLPQHGPCRAVPVPSESVMHFADRGCYGAHTCMFCGRALAKFWPEHHGVASVLYCVHAHLPLKAHHNINHGILWDILGSLEKSMDKRIDDKVQSFMQGPAEATIPVIFRST